MNIQIIGQGWGGRAGFSGVVKSPLSQPKSLDEFDVNVVDLSTEFLWRYRGTTFVSVDDIKDIVSIQQMIANSKKTSVIIILPRNFVCKYHYRISDYLSSGRLKDHVQVLENEVLPKLIPFNLDTCNIYFENTRTDVAGVEYEADFYLGIDCAYRTITKSKLSDKITTVALTDRLYVTSLDITSSQAKTVNFVNALLVPKCPTEKPSWLSDISFYDDILQNEIIRERNEEILRAERAIQEAKTKLQSNARYKSVLYTNGNELVEVVFEMLEKMIGCDLSEFEDKLNEDFLIRTERYTLIGEIKGVTSNVKNDHVGQIEHHYQQYMDDLEDQGLNEAVHQILIINPFRTKPLNCREPVHERQIALAKRNGCLIIETTTLLRLFEAFLENRITTEQCVDLFCNRTGILTITDIPAECAGNLDNYV